MEPLDRTAPAASGAASPVCPPADLRRLPLPAPLARARALLDRATALTPAEWDDVTQRARALDAAAHQAAVRRLWRALVGHPQSRALDALNRAACEVARGAAVGERGTNADATCSYAGRVAAHAVLALALAQELPASDVALLTQPFSDTPSPRK